MRRSLNRIAESEARFRDFAESTADWFWEQDRELRFSYVSQSNEAISGIPAADHIGKRRSDTKKLGISDEAWRRHLETLERREPFKDLRYERIDPAGRIRSLSISGKPIFDADGDFLGYRGSGKDLTDLVDAQRAAEAALVKANAAAAQQKKFAETLAHEFRTPLTIIDGASQRLLRHAEKNEPEDLRARVAKIRSAVRGMASLIDTMLGSARLAAGHVETHKARLDLVAFVAAQISRFDPAVMGREFTLSSDRPTLPLHADGKLLEQIIANLLSNAIKYSGTSRRIDVTLIDAGANVVLRVRDYGIGIPTEELPQLFTRFFRASTAKTISGTGIGLNLVRDLVRLHGGEISVASEVGKGTTFSVELPKEPKSGEAQPVDCA